MQISDAFSAACPPGYEVLRPLGSGGYGEVVLARHLTLNRRVAIKFLRPQALADPDALSRFKREAIVLAGLDAPTIVQVHDVRFGGPSPLIIMEYVPGSPLDEILDGQALAIEEKLTILTDVATALEIAAAKGVVHRDVKPANVFVLPNGRGKLGDFGLARIASSQTLFRTASDSIGGTPAYLPPEIALGTYEPDARSDAYSFAVLAYETLTGRLPFVDRGIAGLIVAHAQEQPPEPQTILPGFPPKASALLLKALDKNPALRPLPRQLVQQLAQIPTAHWPLATIQPTRRPHERTRRIAGTGHRLGPPPPDLLPRRHTRRRRSWVISVLVGLALTGGMLAITLPRAHHHRPLAVLHLTVTASTVTAKCPQAHYTFTANVVTNGEKGQMATRWIRPDGRPTMPQTLPLEKGQRTIEFKLRFSVTGKTPLHNPADFQILSPRKQQATSTPITYHCPGGGSSVTAP